MKQSYLCLSKFTLQFWVDEDHNRLQWIVEIWENSFSSNPCLHWRKHRLNLMYYALCETKIAKTVRLETVFFVHFFADVGQEKFIELFMILVYVTCDARIVHEL